MMIDDQNLHFSIASIGFGNILCQMDAYEVTGRENECQQVDNCGWDYHHISVVCL